MLHVEICVNVLLYEKDARQCKIRQLKYLFKNSLQKLNLNLSLQNICKIDILQ